MTISAYLELEKSSRPAIVTKDLAMVVYGRGDGRIGPRLKNLFQGTFRNPEANRLTGVYEVTLRRALHGSPGVRRRQRRVLDTSNTYVRGEENLRGWRPQGDNLIFEHQWQLEKIQRLTDVERTKHFLLMRDRVGPASAQQQQQQSGRLDKSAKEAVNQAAAAAAAAKPKVVKDPYEPWDMTPREKEISKKYLRLMTYHVHR